MQPLLSNIILFHIIPMVFLLIMENLKFYLHLIFHIFLSFKITHQHYLLFFLINVFFHCYDLNVLILDTFHDITFIVFLIMLMFIILLLKNDFLLFLYLYIFILFIKVNFKFFKFDFSFHFLTLQ